MFQNWIFFHSFSWSTLNRKELLQEIQLCQENLQVPATSTHSSQINTCTHTCTGTASQGVKVHAQRRLWHSALGDWCPHHGPRWSSELCDVEDAICDIEEQLLAEDGISESALYIWLVVVFFLLWGWTHILQVGHWSRRSRRSRWSRKAVSIFTSATLKNIQGPLLMPCSNTWTLAPYMCSCRKTYRLWSPEVMLIGASV